MTGLGPWELADEVLDLAYKIRRLRWWQWRKRREMRGRAVVLLTEGAELGLDLGVLFGLRGRLLLAPGKAGSGDD